MSVSHLGKQFRLVLGAVFLPLTLLLLFEMAARFSQIATKELNSFHFPSAIQELSSAMMIFGITNIPLVLAERVSPGTNHQRNYLQGIKYGLISIVFIYFWSKLAVLILARLHIVPLLTWTIQNNPDTSIGTVSVIIGILLRLLMSDFLYYWFHRAQHHFGLLWRFHKVHHSIVDMNCINSYHHVLEDTLRFPFLTLPLALLVQIDTPQIIFLSAFIAAWGQYIHSDTSIHFGKLSSLFGDNAYHRIHHSIAERHFDKNFAAFFPMWDKLFGTQHQIEPGGLPPVGLTETPPPRSALAFLMMPFQ